MDTADTENVGVKKTAAQNWTPLKDRQGVSRRCGTFRHMYSHIW